MVKTALIVDDSRLARLTLKRLIDKHDIEVFECEGITDAEYWIAHNETPDVIFLDIMMPDIDGFEGLERFRLDSKTKDLPIVMYSGDVTEASRVRARELGATGYLPKPADANRVNHLITVLSKRVTGKSEAESRPEPAVASVDREAALVVESAGVRGVGAIPDVQPEMVAELTRRLEELEQGLAAQVNNSADKGFKINLERQKRDLVFLQRQVANTEKRSTLSLIIASLALLVAVVSVGVGILLFVI